MLNCYKLRMFLSSFLEGLTLFCLSFSLRELGRSNCLTGIVLELSSTGTSSLYPHRRLIGQPSHTVRVWEFPTPCSRDWFPVLSTVTVCLSRGCQVGEEHTTFSGNLILLTVIFPLFKAQLNGAKHTHRAIFSLDGVVE